MSAPEPNTPLGDTNALILGYVNGEVALANVVAAIREVSPGTSGDFAFAWAGQDIPPAMQARIDELLVALSESDRAV